MEIMQTPEEGGVGLEEEEGDDAEKGGDFC